MVRRVTMLLIILSIAREQLRAECAALGRKSYEPAWQTVEIEDHYDWWGMMIVRGRKYDLVYTLVYHLVYQSQC